MKPILHRSTFFLFVGCLLFVLGLGGCRSPGTRDNVVMPPHPPETSEQPDPAEMEAEEVAPEPEDLMAGIRLRLNGEWVELDELEPAPADEELTVHVLVDPATRHGMVVDVMERVHELGYMVVFQSE